MYAAAFLVSASVTASTTGSLPFFQLGSVGPLPIQWFGVIVAIGVLIGAGLLRRYAEWHGVSDDHIRGLTGWVVVSGFLGAHLFDTLFYEWDRMIEEPLLLFKLWDGISSYGGFVGGSIGFTLYVWWKRLPARLFADITVVGLLPAFSIGRIGCTVVSDHIGSAMDPNAWYSFLGMPYPIVRTASGAMDSLRTLKPIKMIVNADPELLHSKATEVLAWNLGLVEFLYLIPVNLLILWLAFRSTRRTNAGLVVVMTGMLYAPVRFFLDYLRPNITDPRHLGFTFAQWCSIVAFSVAGFVALRVFKNGKPAVPLFKTSGEAQAALKVVLKDDVKVAEPTAKKPDDKKPADDKKPVEDAKPADLKSDDDAKPAEDAKADDAKPAPDEVATIRPGDRPKMNPDDVETLKPGTKDKKSK